MASKTKKPRKTNSERAMEAIAPIIERLEAGDPMVWRKPWTPGSLHVGASDRPYSGVNALNTMLVAGIRGYESRRWWTFDRIMEAGGAERTEIKFPNGGRKTVWKGGRYSVAGSKGKWLNIVLLKPLLKEEQDGDTGETSTTFVKWLLRFYSVLNLDEVTGMEDEVKYPEHLTGEQQQEADPIAACEQVIADWEGRPKIHHTGDRACYYPKRDLIHMPKPEQFGSMEEYYATLFHESGHATGHENRLKRKGVMEATKFGSVTYGVEEIVAETCAAGLCGVTGIAAPIVENSAAYCQHWLKVISADPVQFIRMAGHGVRAVQHILGEEPDYETSDKAPDEAVAAA